MPLRASSFPADFVRAITPALDALTGSLNTARYAHQAVLLANGQVLVVDGTDVSSAGTFDLNSTELYNPATGKLSLPRFR